MGVELGKVEERKGSDGKMREDRVRVGEEIKERRGRLMMIGE